jgi:hypothetical protein
VGAASIAIAFAIFFLAIEYPQVMGPLLGLEDRQLPTDQELISNFKRHRAGFDRLRDMIMQDKGLLRITNDRTLPEDPQAVGVSQSRIAEYRALLKELGIHELDASLDRKTIQLTSAYRGFVTHGAQKGYEYASEPIRTYLVPDLEMLSKGGVGRRPIEDGWYLFFEGY